MDRSRKHRRRKPTSAELDAEVQRTIIRWESATRMVVATGRSAAWCGIAGFLYLIAIAVAGKESSLQVAVDALARLGLDWTTTALLGAVAILFLVVRVDGFFVYRRKVARMGARIRELERRTDPARESSGLDPSGATAKEDR